MVSFSPILGLTLLVAAVSAQSTCSSSQQYNVIPGFPASNAGCVPTNYLSTSDLGNTSPTDAETRCQQGCTNLANCGSVIAQVNKAADSNLYSGTCFYYAPGSTPTAPRSCANPVYLLEGYVKDYSVACFSSSTAAATTFCRSILSNTVTSTVTTTPATSTSTVTKTSTVTASVTTTTTNTVSATSTTTATATITSNVSTTSTSTVTTVATVTSTAAGNKRRAKRATTTAPTPACITSGTPNSRLTSACSCFNAKPSTITQTNTAATPITTLTKTTTTTTTTTIIQTATTTVTSSTVTVTSSTTTTATSTASALTTVTNTVTVTTTAAAGASYCGTPVGSVPTASTSGTVTCPNTAASPSSNALIRIEGGSGNVYEGCAASGPKQITTPSGGTHQCDGTNNNANPSPFNNGITLIDAASQKGGFTYDGSYSAQFSDFFITRIGTSDSSTSGNQFWGILLNEAFTPAGGCETEVFNGDRLLWAFNAFNVNFFLTVSPGYAAATAGSGSVTVTVQGNDGSGNATPLAGASIAGVTTNSQGQATIPVPSTPGCYQYKATRSDSIRSNTFYLSVYAAFS